MQSILIVEPSETFRIELKRELESEHYQVFCCADGEEGLTLLQDHHPDGLILNLFLREFDGLSFLEAIQGFRPQVIITLSTYYPPYLELTLADLRVGHKLLMPCTIYSVTHRLCDMLQKIGLPSPPDARQIIARHLQRMKYPARSGFYMLLAAVPLFAQDRNQGLTKELYPAVVALCGKDNWRQVESAIRDAKRSAWKHRDRAVWEEYFPGATRCPSNWKFLSCLADLLDAEKEP